MSTPRVTLNGAVIRDEFPTLALLFQHAADRSRQPFLIGIMEQVQKRFLRPGLPLRHPRIVGKQGANRGDAERVALHDIAVARVRAELEQEIGGLLQGLIGARGIVAGQEPQLLELRNRQPQFAQGKSDLLQAVEFRRIVTIQRRLVAGEHQFPRQAEKLGVIDSAAPARSSCEISMISPRPTMAILPSFDPSSTFLTMPLARPNDRSSRKSIDGGSAVFLPGGGPQARARPTQGKGSQ